MSSPAERKGKGKVPAWDCPQDKRLPAMGQSFGKHEGASKLPKAHEVMLGLTDWLSSSSEGLSSLFSYEVFHDRIDQGIDSIKDTLLNFINDGIAFLILLDGILNVFFGCFSKTIVPPLLEFACKS